MKKLILLLVTVLGGVAAILVCGKKLGSKPEAEEIEAEPADESDFADV